MQQEVTKSKNSMLLGILGLLSLLVPVNIGFWGTQGVLVAWHLLRVAWQGSNFYNDVVFSSSTAISLSLSFLAVVGFSLVLVGSVMVIKGKRIGGWLLLASLVFWFLYTAIEFIRVEFYLVIPVGAVLSGALGIIVLLKK
ncbi:MAG: hypothetical protein ACM3JE_04000 [Betaproteobacteria bacterium]